METNNKTHVCVKTSENKYSTVIDSDRLESIIVNSIQNDYDSPITDANLTYVNELSPGRDGYSTSVLVKFRTKNK